MQLTDREIVDRQGEEVALDIEIYKNYLLIVFDFFDGGEVTLEVRGNQSIGPADKIVRKFMWILQNYTVYTFNGIGFDVPVLLYAATRSTTVRELFDVAQEIIRESLYWMKFYQKYKIAWGDFRIDHVDLIELAIGQHSLKMYAGRLHTPFMQDLPYDPYIELTEDQMDDVLAYCLNDTYNTKLLKNELQKQLDLRVEMGAKYLVDIRSKSDAQIAEAVISKELEYKYDIRAQRVNLRKIPPDFSFRYQVPENIKFETQYMNEVLDIVRNADFKLGEDFKPKMPEEISKLLIRINKTNYNMGMGGLHSNEHRVRYDTTSDDCDYDLFDRDVASYYPAIILNQQLYPTQLTANFSDIYRTIVNERLSAKRTGDKVKADSLKITINGSFGKFGSPYSILFSPELLIQTTVSGQLYLLMLIEDMEEAGFEVVSGNTDGFVTKVQKGRKDEFERIVHEWERATDFVTEETQYSKLFSRDVNNYIAVKPDGEVKSKGAFADSTISKNPAGSIIYEAVREFISRGVPVEDTINSCRDIRKFLYVRKVNGGCVDSDGNYIGKVIRWYYDKHEFRNLKYCTNGNKVPNSDGAKVLMDISELPVDIWNNISYNRYLHEAKKILNIDFKKIEQMELF